MIEYKQETITYTNKNETLNITLLYNEPSINAIKNYAKYAKELIHKRVENL